MSVKTGHTKAPWKVRYDAENGTFELLMDTALRNPGVYTSVHHIELYDGVYREDKEDYREAKANAYLMAASPKLLAACRQCAEICEDGDTGASFERVVEAMKAAADAIKLAKA